MLIDECNYREKNREKFIDQSSVSHITPNSLLASGRGIQDLPSAEFADRHRVRMITWSTILLLILLPSVA